MWSGISDRIYTEHVVRYCWQHLHRACGEVLLTAFTQSMWQGIADWIYTEHVVRYIWLHLDRSCGEVLLTAFRQIMWWGIADSIYTEHVVRYCWQHLHRACGQVLLTGFTQSMWSGIADWIYTVHAVLTTAFTQSMGSGLADRIHTDQSGQVLHGVLRPCWPHSHRAVWSGIANHLHTEQSGHVLHGVLRSCWLLIPRLCVTQALCNPLAQLPEIPWVCESSAFFCTHNCWKHSGYVRAPLSFVPTTARDVLGMWEHCCLSYPQLLEILWVCESSTVFCTHNCQRYSGYVRTPPSFVPRRNRE